MAEKSVGEAPVATGEASKAERTDEQDTSPGDVEGGTGICLSGGGVRSASFCLGALQVLERKGYLTGPDRARYLSAVSGGSYIAGALAMVALCNERERPAGMVREAMDPGPFAEGSVEESFLRNHLSYLTHGPGGLPAFVWRMLLGILLNFALLGLILQVVGRPLGWAYGYFFDSLRLRSLDATVAIPTWAVWTAVGLGCLAVGIGWVAVCFRGLEDSLRTKVLLASGIVLGAALAFVVFVIALPELLVFMRGSVARLGGAQHQTVQANTSVARSTSRLAGLAGGSAAVSVVTILAGLRAKPEVRAELQQGESAIRKKLASWMAKHRGFVLNLIAAISVPVGLIAAFVLFVEIGAANTVGAPPHGSLVEGAYRLAGARHPVGGSRSLLRSELNVDAFVLQTGAVPSSSRWFVGLAAPTVRSRRRRFPTTPSIAFLSRSHNHKTSPSLLVCSAVNISNYGLTPTGKKVASFVFSAKNLGSTNCDSIGLIPTDMYEEGVSQRMRPDLTLPAAVSISGAAISPEMGKMTRAPLRALLALGNVRLGVWVPNPANVDRYRARQNRRLFPYAFTHASYLLREMFGYDHANSKFLYVTDGGHYENLGLVELLRKRCTKIVCIDASGEKIDSFGTIFDAIRMADSELQVDFSSFDPTVMGPAAHDPTLVETPYVKGKFSYDGGKVGEIVIVKAGVPIDAPAELLDYRKGNPSFPYDTTLDQFFGADRFDAYRRLGALCTEKALQDEDDNDPAGAAPAIGTDALAATDHVNVGTADVAARDGNAGGGSE